MKKRTISRMALGAAAALLGLVIAPVLTASAASAAPIGGGGPYTCTGGNVPPGTYRSILVTGVCYTPVGTIVVRGNLTVAPGALLDAVTPGDPPASATTTPVVPATVLIGGNVFVGKGAVLLFGCSPNISCGPPHPGISFDRIGGNLTAIGAQGVVVHSATIGGSASLLGGGGGAAAETCNAQSPGQPPIADLEPWSEDQGFDGIPVYSDFEDNSIGGNLTVAGLTSCWAGSFRNQTGGNLTYTGNTMGDPDASEIANNLLGGSITCLRNSPAVQFGDSSAAPNIVGGLAFGECGFGVVLLNPAPEAMEGAGIYEHITVSTGSLKTYYGTHTATPNTSIPPVPPVTTESGYTITLDLNNFTLAGTGLVGSGTYNPSIGPELSGDAVLTTVYPNGSKSFIAYDACNCSLGGLAGTTLLRFYGTTSPSGLTYGTFLITSGGAYPVVPGETTNGALATLAGWGTFSSAGQPAGTWSLVEHLRIT